MLSFSCFKLKKVITTFKTINNKKRYVSVEVHVPNFIGFDNFLYFAEFFLSQLNYPYAYNKYGFSDIWSSNIYK